MIARLPRRLQVLPTEQADRADAVVEGQIWTGKMWKVRLVVRSQKTGATAGYAGLVGHGAAHADRAGAARGAAEAGGPRRAR